MKKIYLIDDNSKNQREAYGASYVDENEYADCLVHIERMNSDSDFTCLNNAACILVHDSLEDFIDGDFQKDSHKARVRIEDFFDRPYAQFSDGHSISADWREATPNIVYQIKKSEFYLHLRAFLEHYRATSQIDMRIVAFGKDFNRHLACRWGQAIASSLSGLNESEKVSINHLDKNTRQALRNLLEISRPKVAISFDEVMENVEDGQIIVGNFLQNINNIVNSIIKYGKNISSWK